LEVLRIYQDYDESDPKSHEGLDLNQVTTRQLT